MRKINVLTMVAAVTVALATTSVTAYASEGIDVVVSGRTFDEAPVVEEPAHEEPAPVVEPEVEPAPAEPTPAPTPVEEPTVEPTVEPTPAPTPVVEPTVEPTPAPTPAQEEVTPSSNDDNNGGNESSDNNNDDNNNVEPTPVQTVVTPVVVEETPAPAAVTTTATTTSVRRAAAPVVTTTEVLGVNRAAKVVPEDVEEVEVTEEFEEENDEAGASILALLFALLVALGALIFFLLGRKYQVIKKTVDEDGEVSEEILKKFFTIEKACEYVRDFEWDAEDRDYDSLRIENKSYDEEYEDENGNTQYNGQYVYVVSEDHAQEAIINASDNEVDAIGRILGFVQEEVLA